MTFCLKCRTLCLRCRTFCLRYMTKYNIDASLCLKDGNIKYNIVKIYYHNFSMSARSTIVIV